MNKHNVPTLESASAPNRFRSLQGCYYKHRHRFERQHLELLANAEGWTVPSQTILQLLKVLGYDLVRAYLPPDRHAETDFAASVVRVAADLEMQLHHKPAMPAVLAASLGHELAHIMLGHKPGPQGQRKANWEPEAYVWAYQFLCPWYLLGSRPEVRALKGGMLNKGRVLGCLYDLADWLGLTVSFTRKALELYGIVEYGQLAYCTGNDRPQSGPEMVAELLLRYEQKSESA